MASSIKKELIRKIELAAKWIRGSKHVPYSDDFKAALECESEKTLEEDLALAKEKMVEADPFATEKEIEEYLK